MSQYLFYFLIFSFFILCFADNDPPTPPTDPPEPEEPSSPPPEDNDQDDQEDPKDYEEDANYVEDDEDYQKPFPNMVNPNTIDPYKLIFGKTKKAYTGEPTFPRCWSQIMDLMERNKTMQEAICGATEYDLEKGF